MANKNATVIKVDVAKSLLDAVEIIKAQARAEAFRECGELYQQLLDFAENGDYSNGNAEFGVDEGRVLAFDCIKEFRKIAESLKSGKLEG